MNTIRPNPGAFHASFLAACTIGGIRVALAPPDVGPAEFKAATDRLTEIGSEFKSRMEGWENRLSDAEQRASRRGGLGAPVVLKSWGQRFVEGTEYKSAAEMTGGRDVHGRRYRATVSMSEIEHKNITSVSGSGAALIPADRRVDSPALLPWVGLTVRDLVAPGTTTAAAVTYPRMTSRTNAAAMVAEGAVKPKSDMAFEEVTAVVRTLAHMFIASRQIMDDAPALAAVIDAEARAGLADVEDAQMLFGDGTGQNLSGLVPQASPLVRQWKAVGATPFDVLLQALAQVEAGEWKADGLVLNSVDWRMMQGIKDGMGRYIGGGPLGPEAALRLWQIPVAATNRMPQGTFLIGPFRTQAQVFDRMGVEVLLSTEHADLFEKNMVAIRAEERLAFTIKRPSAFVKGNLNTDLS